ncbi:outer membrane protein assembly factor BamD [Candidatus Riflebacteria bacterium]
MLLMESSKIFTRDCTNCGRPHEFYEGKVLAFCDYCRSKIYATSPDDVYYRESFLARWFNIKSFFLFFMVYFFIFGGIGPIEIWTYYLGRYYQDASHYSMAFAKFKRLLRKYPQTSYKEDVKKRLAYLLLTDQDKDGYTLAEELEHGTNPRHYKSHPSYTPRANVDMGSPWDKWGKLKVWGEK